VWVSAASTHCSALHRIAELGAAIPRSGGQYNFSRRALGDYAGFAVDGVIGSRPVDQQRLRL